MNPDSLHLTSLDQTIHTHTVYAGALRDPRGKHGSFHLAEHLMVASISSPNDLNGPEFYGYVTPFLTVVGAVCAESDAPRPLCLDTLPLSYSAIREFIKEVPDSVFEAERGLILGEVGQPSTPFMRHLNYAMGFATPAASRFGAAGSLDYLTSVTKEELAASVWEGATSDTRVELALADMYSDDWTLVKEQNADSMLVDITNASPNEGSCIAFVIPKEFMYFPEELPGLFALKLAYAVGGGDHSPWYRAVRALGGYHAHYEFHVAPFGALVLLNASVAVSYDVLHREFINALNTYPMGTVANLPLFKVRDYLPRLLEVEKLIPRPPKPPKTGGGMKRVVEGIMSKGVMFSVKRERKFTAKAKSS